MIGFSKLINGLYDVIAGAIHVSVFRHIHIHACNCCGTSMAYTACSNDYIIHQFLIKTDISLIVGCVYFKPSKWHEPLELMIYDLLTVTVR